MPPQDENESESSASSSPAPDTAEKNKFDAEGYWKANLKLIGILLSIWAIVSYGCSILFIEQLNTLTIGKVPLGFWMSQQGSIYVFVVLILVYAWQMEKLDHRYGVGE